MAQIMVTGLAEVLADHEDKIAAAQAWCVRKNIGSIEELREKGDAAVDEFIGAAGIGEFLHQFIVKRRIGEYGSVLAPAPAPKRKKPAAKSAAARKPAAAAIQAAPFESNARSILGDAHAVAGLAEVLREHEEKIPAAQAWCKQQSIRSIDELKSQGKTAIDAFVKAAGAIKMIDAFIIKRRIGEYVPPPPPPPAAPTPSPPLWATAEPKPAPYEDNARSLLGNYHAARCLRLRQTLPRLEMPCVRAATATIGVLLYRAGVTELAIRRLIYAFAFAVPTDDERRAEAARDAKFVEDYGRGRTKNIMTTSTGPDPPMRRGALAAAVTEAHAGPPGMTKVAREMTSLADAPEAYDLYIFADEGFETVEFRTLLQFEAAFPAIVGCETLTIRSKFARQTSICVGGRVRHIREAGGSFESDKAFFTGELALPPIEHTFAAPRRSSSGRGYFAVADLARGLNVLPEEWRQLSRVRGLVAWDASDDGNLSFGRFESPNAYGHIDFGTCTLMVDWACAEFSLDGDRGVLDVEWLLVCDGMFNVMSSQPEPRDCFGQGASLAEMDPVEPRRDLRWSHDDENYYILEKWCGDVIYREKDVDDLPLHRLRRTVIDAERWLNPGIFRDCPDYLPYYVYDPRQGCLLVAPREH